ncbi:MAG: cytochrome C oxidase subunit IV family protein [Candidatus Omnitrophica bacterium]|nr:cytochrome C oxidase subunit IV family protein [Candidatus Omnitrophota bacterium]
MSNDTHNLKKEVSLYFKVFGSLAVLTVITVAISNIHLAIFLAVAIALIVATIKASLVAAFFMHLSHERKVIYFVLISTACFFVGMIGLILGSYYSVPHGTRDLNLDYKHAYSAHHDGGEVKAEGETHSTTSVEVEHANNPETPETKNVETPSTVDTAAHPAPEGETH